MFYCKKCLKIQSITFLEVLETKMPTRYPKLRYKSLGGPEKGRVDINNDFSLEFFGNLHVCAIGLNIQFRQRNAGVEKTMGVPITIFKNCSHMK